MPNPEAPVPESDLEPFLEEPTDDLNQWAWLWERDHPFPVISHRGGLAGKIIVAFKRLLRPFVRAPLADLWERQRIFNQILIAHQQETHRSLVRLADDVDSIGKDIQTVQQEILADIRAIQRDINGNVKGLSTDLDDFRRKGMVDLMRHTDALFSRLDQKVDRVRRQVRAAAVEGPLEESGSRQ